MTVMTDETEVRRAKRSWPAQYKLDILNEPPWVRWRLQTLEARTLLLVVKS